MSEEENQVSGHNPFLGYCIILLFAVLYIMGSIMPAPDRSSLTSRDIAGGKIAVNDLPQAGPAKKKFDSSNPAETKNNMAFYSLTNHWYDISISDDDIENKMRPTVYSLPRSQKTRIPRLTPEEIAAAPIVRQIPMNLNGENFVMFVVEKDGNLYDASDGVRVYVPFDIEREVAKVMAGKRRS